MMIIMKMILIITIAGEVYVCACIVIIVDDGINMKIVLAIINCIIVRCIYIHKAAGKCAGTQYYECRIGTINKIGHCFCNLLQTEPTTGSTN